MYYLTKVEFFRIQKREKTKSLSIQDKINRALWFKNYYRLHKDKINSNYRNRYKKSLKFNTQFKLKINLARRLRAAILENWKSGHTLELLDCSIDFLKQHLESQFKEGMNWSNYGLKGWHIDHIKPCASFNLNKKSEQIKCFHYTNLQPLWWYDNLKKSDNV